MEFNLMNFSCLFLLKMLELCAVIGRKMQNICSEKKHQQICPSFVGKSFEHQKKTKIKDWKMDIISNGI